MSIRPFVCATLALASLQGFADEPPTMGWSSWNTYRVHINEELICRQADAMVEKGLDKLGYKYINIDDGFFGGRNSEGQLLIHPRRFPNGLAPVVRHIHGLGLKAGIYSDAGANTCGHYWDNDTIAHGVGFYGHDKQDAEYYFNTLGFDFIKIDFCGGDPGQNKGHLDLDEHERYSSIRRAIDKAGRKDVRINVCRWAFPGTWVHDIGSSWRIAADIQPNWNAVKRIIKANRYLSAYATGGAFNDMDMLEIGRGLSTTEERTHFGMWCMLSSPLLIGCDMTTIPEASLRLISNPELIALNQDPLCLQAHIVKVTDEVYLYVKDVKTLNGTTRAVAICNLDDSKRTFKFTAAEVELGGKVKARDLFARQDIAGIADDEGHFTVNVNAHDTQIYLLSGEKRLERTVYEAETAWLERYQEIGMNPSLGYAKYAEMPAASGGAKVEWLGNHADNWLEWCDVFSEKGGVYELTLSYVSDKKRSVFCTVNHGKTTEIACPAGTVNCPQTSAPLRIVLKKGSNTIRISNADNWCPDIDKITLRRVEDIYGIDLHPQKHPQIKRNLKKKLRLSHRGK